MIDWMLERLSQYPGAVFSERELVERDAESFTEFVNARLLRRLPVDYVRPAIVHQGRPLRLITGADDGVIEAIDDEDIEFEPAKFELADVVRWELNLEAWAGEFAVRHDATGGPRRLTERIWWLGTAYDRVPLYLLLPRDDLEFSVLLDGLPAETGSRRAVVVPQHIPRMPPSSGRAPLVAWLTDDGLGTSPHLRDAVIDPPPGGYTEPVPGFRHSQDFRSVYWRDELFSLTTQQARAVEILLTAFLNRTPEVSQAYILEEMEIEGSALRFIFRGSLAWNCLVVSGSTSGTFRLAL